MAARCLACRSLCGLRGGRDCHWSCLLSLGLDDAEKLPKALLAYFVLLILFVVIHHLTNLIRQVVTVIIPKVGTVHFPIYRRRSQRFNTHRKALAQIFEPNPIFQAKLTNPQFKKQSH